MTEATPINAKWDENGEPMTLAAAALDADEWMRLMESQCAQGVWAISPTNIERLRECRRELHSFLKQNPAGEQPKTGGKMELHERLRKYNRWRRGEEDWTDDERGPDPKELAELIDEAADRLEVLERESAAFFARWHEERRRMDWIGVYGTFCVDSVTGELGGNGKKRIQATRELIDAHRNRRVKAQ